MRRVLALTAVLIAVLIAALSSGARAQAPAPRDLVINEVMYDPPTGGATNEWIEVFNRSERAIDLNTVQFADSTSAPVEVTSTTLLLAPGAFAVLVRNPTEFAIAFPDVPAVPVTSFPTLNNDGDRPKLLVGSTVIDVVPYDDSWVEPSNPDRALERKDPNGPSNSESNFELSTDPRGGTPGEVNSVFEVDTAPPELEGAVALTETTVAVTFSEPVAAGPEDFSISDGIGPPVSVAVDPDDPLTLVLTLAAPLAGPRTYTLTVTGVEDAAGNALASAQTTFFFGTFDTPGPSDVVVNEIMYDPPTGGSGNEWVEVFNRTADRTFDLAAFRYTDAGDDTVAVAGQPMPLGPGAYAVLASDPAAFEAANPGVPFIPVPNLPALTNTGDRPTLLFDSVGVDAVPYDDAWVGTSDPNRSLERKDPAGPSTSAANFALSTDPDRGTPGALNSVFAPDVAGPQLAEVTPSLRGDTLFVRFDEPVDPASFSAGAFALSGPSAPGIASATLAASGDAATLVLSGPLEPGDYTLAASGLRDPLGNASDGAPFAFSFEPDRTPPNLASAFTLDATTVEVRFSEPVTTSAAEPARYTIDGGTGQPQAVVFPLDGDPARVLLVLTTPLAERQLYTLTVSGVEDLTGNVLEPATAPLFVGEADAPQVGDLVINEVMYDPANGSAGEYVELFNRSGKLFDLRTLALSDDAAADAPPVTDVPSFVLPGALAAIVADRDSFAVRFPDAPAVEARDFPGLNNDGDAVVLSYGGLVVDSVFYDPSWHRIELEDATGISLERRDPAGPSNSAANWSSSLDPSGGTPGDSNSVFVVPGEPPAEAGLDVDSPFDPDGGQAAAIRFTLETDAALVRARIFDGAGRLVRELEDGALVGRTGTLLWDGRDASARPLRIGIYVVLLEAVNVEGGTTEAHRAAVVLARRF